MNDQPKHNEDDSQSDVVSFAEVAAGITNPIKFVTVEPLAKELYEALVAAQVILDDEGYTDHQGIWAAEIGKIDAALKRYENANAPHTVERIICDRPPQDPAT